jgi:hypothetical protein
LIEPLESAETNAANRRGGELRERFQAKAAIVGEKNSDKAVGQPAEDRLGRRSQNTAQTALREDPPR